MRDEFACKLASSHHDDAVRVVKDLWNLVRRFLGATVDLPFYEVYFLILII